jgi:hypothetical protein
MSAAPQHQEIYQRDDGQFEVGLGEDSLGPFPSREFALSIAGYALPTPSIPFRKIKLKETRRAGTSP